MSDTSHGATASAPQPGAFAPLRQPVFAVLWAATVLGNIGSFMRDVASSWLVTDLSANPTAVALIQTAATLPIFLLAIPAGVLSDILDRRRFLIFVQLVLAAVLVRDRLQPPSPLRNENRWQDGDHSLDIVEDVVQGAVRRSGRLSQSGLPIYARPRQHRQLIHGLDLEWIKIKREVEPVPDEFIGCRAHHANES